MEQCEKQFQMCSRRFDSIEAKVDKGIAEIVNLLRGVGDDAGLVGHVSQNTQTITTLKGVVFGDKGESGLTYQVQQLMANGRNRNTAEEERKAFWRGMISKLITAAIIALAAFLLGLYRSL